MFPDRFLVLLDSQGFESGTRIRQLKLERLILRKLSYCVEVDFRSDRINRELVELGMIGRILSYEQVDERPIAYSTLRKDEYNSIISQTEQYLNNERYWIAHTKLELIWACERGERKKGVQAIIWLLASMVHFQMDEPDVAEKLYLKSRESLERSNSFDIFRQLREKFEYPCFLDLSSLKL